MEPKFEQPIQHTPEEVIEIEKQRVAYDKEAGNAARKQNSFSENLNGKGMTKEDVVRYDARLENKIFDWAPDSPRARAYPELLDTVQKSSLTISSKEIKESLWAHVLSGSLDRDLGDEDDMEGLIGGREVKIRSKYNKDYKPGEDSYDIKYIWSGEIDGETISADFAEKLFNKYQHAAQVRTRQLSEAAEKDKIREDFKRDEKKYPGML